jgi:hypothetical protein
MKIIPNLVEKKRSFPLEKDIFSTGSGNRGFSFWHKRPMPGQKGIRLAKKGGDSSISRCGLLRFVAEPSLSPRVSLRKEREKEEAKLPPGRFCLRRLPSCPGNDEAVMIHQLILR